MKKQLFSIFIVIALILSGCGENQPTRKNKSMKWEPVLASEEMIPYATRAIEIIDKYLSFQKSWDESREDFMDLFFRSADLIYTDIYTADHTIKQILSGLNSNKKSEAEYRYLKDVLCFYAGKPVSGAVYPAEKNIYNYTEGYDATTDFVKIVDIDEIPFMSGTAHNDNLGKEITLNFDQMNGVSVSDLQGYIEKMLIKMQDAGEQNLMLSVNYSRFEQSIFRIFILKNSELFYGNVSRADWTFERIRSDYWKKYTVEQQAEHRMSEKYPSGFEIMETEKLYEFQNPEDLNHAISAAKQFVG